MKNWLFILIVIPVFFSCQKEIKDDRVYMPVTVRFMAVAGSQPLEFGMLYQNQYGEDIIFSAFKFYIHQLKIGGYSIGTESHYLVDFNKADPAFSITGFVPEGNYSDLNFYIGVDSTRNFSGAQSGALDPLHGMFWTWSTGYIMAKMEGVSSFANTPGNAVEYHIGGFSGEQNVTKHIMLPATIESREGNELIINIKADALKWFGGESNISIADNPVCMTPGELAKSIAGNYYKMFSIETVQ